MHLKDYLHVFQLIFLRYILTAALAFFVFYKLLKKRNRYKKIQRRMPANKDYQREIGFSILTSIIFAFVPFFFLFNAHIVPHTTFYKNIQQHGWFWFFAAFPVMFFMHDAYFYWAHRLMHHPRLFKWFHLVHHKSVNPSPWAAYAFHPLEAFIEAGIFIIFLFTIPVHPIHIGVFFLFMIMYNVYGHLGWELYPKGFANSKVGRWVNTSVSHNQHHQYFKGNYGLYTLIWDRWMGTIRPDYETRFEEVKSRRSEAVVIEMSTGLPAEAQQAT